MGLRENEMIYLIQSARIATAKERSNCYGGSGGEWSWLRSWSHSGL